LVFAAIIIVGYFFIKEVSTKIKWNDFIKLLETKGKIKLEQRTKDELKKEGQKIEGEIYKQATEHNPKGDLLPDQVDDNLKKELKKEIKKKIE